MTTLRMNLNDLEYYAKMYWHRVYHEQYSDTYAREQLTKNGLRQSQIDRIVKLADSKAYQWDANLGKLEREG